MYLIFRLSGGHVVKTDMPQDLQDTYEEDPLAWGAALESQLNASPLHTVKDRHGRQVFIRSEYVVSWEVLDY